VLTKEEVSALLGLNGQTKQVAAHIDFVRLGEQVEHCCLVVDGLVGRFGLNRDGVRQITCLHIPEEMADLPSVVSPKAGWALGALTSTRHTVTAGGRLLRGKGPDRILRQGNIWRLARPAYSKDSQDRQSLTLLFDPPTNSPNVSSYAYPYRRK
jgi:hypothetical protein